MTKEGLEKYARENRKRLDSQEVKIGDVVKVLVGQFAGETGIVIGIIACDESDYTDPYYEIALNCEVPEKYKCRKTLITPNNVAGGFAAHDFEVIGNRAPKQPSMAIKQGDTVRVSKDAPEMYIYPDSPGNRDCECIVKDTDGDNAYIEPKELGYFPFTSIIPTKYLVKVDAEAKEPKFKVGDRVRHMKVGQTWKVTAINGDLFTLKSDFGHENVCFGAELELIEPTEKTEASADVLGEFTPISMSTNPIIGFEQAYWQKYEADLAKEVAVMLVRTHRNDLNKVAKMSVDIAKAVVEGLKRK